MGATKRKTKARMGRPKLPEGERKGEAVTMRVDPATSERLDGVAERLGLGRSTAARECLVAGLAVLERKAAKR